MSSLPNQQSQSKVEETKEAKFYLDEVTGEQVSKTELKKRQKKRENDAKLAEKKKI